jgi:deazaflavin-dependent oxidoreductase (nitroreductase family)
MVSPPESPASHLRPAGVASSAQRLMMAAHEFWYRLSGGWIGGNILGATILLLTTTGRRSGRAHTAPLLYMRDGDDFIVIASNAGAARHPSWWLNLQAHPQCDIQVMSRLLHVLASEAQAEERERLWKKIVARYPIYATYARRTSRRIPVVVLRGG